MKRNLKPASTGQPLTKGTFLLLLFLGAFQAVRAQSIPRPKIQSPNTASLGTFGEIPVSHFTGTPDISIPLHTISTGKISIPITLRYHPAMVKPNQHPGWVGFGWDLSSYGSISRSVKGLLDEDNVSATMRTYHPNTTITANASGSAQLQEPVTTPAPAWPTSTQLNQYFNWENFPGDPLADEFSFNVAGLSGKFFYTYEGWRAVCDQNVKVELNGFMTANEIMLAMQGYDYSGSASQPVELQPRMYKGFTLTTDDGTRYIFGVSDAVPNSNDAIEFQSGYTKQTDAFAANTWQIKRIIDVEGNYVDFKYDRTYPSANLSFYSRITDYSCHTDWYSESGWTSASVTTDTRGGFLQWTVYLREVSTTEEKVTFKTSFSNELNYSQDYLKCSKVNGLGCADNASINTSRLDVNANNEVTGLKWEQLNEITVTSSFKTDPVRRYQFYYNNAPNQRLSLRALYEVDRDDVRGKTYQFDYNDYNEGGAPIPYGGNKTDHWGFYNGKELNGVSYASLATDKRQPNPAVATKGLLSRIMYPTKGYTDFEWEPHQYRYYVSTDRMSLADALSNTTAGGCRIKTIRSYADPTAQPVVKNYYYVRNYTRGANISTLISSGVLNGLPQYEFVLSNRPGMYNSGPYSIRINSVHNLGSFSYNSAGSHIGYDEVIEESENGAYTRSAFTNYGTDIHGTSHFDRSADRQDLAVIGWVEGTDKYITMSSLERERGKPTGIFHYNNNNQLVERTLLRYRTDAARFDKCIRRTDLRNSFGCKNFDAVVLASAYKEYGYNYYVTSKEVTRFDKDGGNPVTTVTSYQYSSPLRYSYTSTDPVTPTTISLEFLKEVREQQSNGDEAASRLNYPTDFFVTGSGAPTSGGDAAAWALKRMKDDLFMVGIAVEKQELLRPSGQTSFSLLRSSVTKYREFTTNRVRPWEEFVYRTERSYATPVATQITSAATLQLDPYHPGANDPGYERAASYLRYNTRGNVVNLQEENGISVCYLWGYNGTLPIAEIRNATWTEVSKVLTDINLTEAQVEALRNGTGIQGLINSLRGQLPDAMVSGYTYDPLVGMTSQTDPAGKTTSFVYDGLNRLRLVRDQSNRIVKGYFYHYKK